MYSDKKEKNDHLKIIYWQHLISIKWYIMILQSWVYEFVKAEWFHVCLYHIEHRGFTLLRAYTCGIAQLGWNHKIFNKDLYSSK